MRRNRTILFVTVLGCLALASGPACAQTVIAGTATSSGGGKTTQGSMTSTVSTANWVNPGWGYQAFQPVNHPSCTSDWQWGATLSVGKVGALQQSCCPCGA